MSDEQPTINYKDIPGHMGYRIGDDGSVWSALRRIGLGAGRGTKIVVGEAWRRLKPSPQKHGHLHVTLLNRRDYLVHRLVLENFVGSCPPGMECCHEDGNPANNRVANLRWDTPQANANDRELHGRTARGDQGGNRRLSGKLVPLIRAEYATGKITLQMLAIKHGVSFATIHRVVTRKGWAHIA